MLTLSMGFLCSQMALVGMRDKQIIYVQAPPAT